jgi:anti-sigma factor RsiW
MSSMNEYRETPFDEALLSGYLDGELTQAEAQRVRLRLEEDAAARTLVDELGEIREAARSTRLPTPADDEWNEAPRSGVSRILRRSGWLLVILWVAALAGLVAWGVATGPENWLERAFTVGLIGGPALLLTSVFIDRIKVMKHDRYRRVKK